MQLNRKPTETHATSVASTASPTPKMKEMTQETYFESLGLNVSEKSDRQVISKEARGQETFEVHRDEDKYSHSRLLREVKANSSSRNSNAYGLECSEGYTTHKCPVP